MSGVVFTVEGNTCDISLVMPEILANGILGNLRSPQCLNPNDQGATTNLQNENVGQQAVESYSLFGA